MTRIPFRTGPPNGRILVVDDDRYVRNTIAELLERRGFGVLQAEDAGQAAAMARTNPIDAFLLDIELPGTSGIELCRMLRAMDEYKLTPIVFITGAMEREQIVEAFAAVAGRTRFVRGPLGYSAATPDGARYRGDQEWIAYGYALVTCAPDTRVWVALGLSRTTFQKKYIQPFFDTDHTFSELEPALYRRLQLAWGGIT